MDKETYIYKVKNGLKGVSDSEAMIEEIENHIEHHLFYSIQEGKSEAEAMECWFGNLAHRMRLYLPFRKNSLYPPVRFYYSIYSAIVLYLQQVLPLQYCMHG